MYFNKIKYLKISILSITLSIAIIGAGAIVGCKKNAEKEDSVYITGTEFLPSRNFSVINSGDAVAITATASKILDEDETIEFSVDPGKVDNYNVKNGINYLVLPESSYELPVKNALIKKGTNLSESVKLIVRSVEEIKEGTNYLLPITLRTSSKNLPALNGSNVLYLIVTRATVTSAPKLNGLSYFEADFNKNNDNLKNMKAFTLEARVNLSEFPVYNRNNLMGILGNVGSDKTGNWLFVDGTPDRTGVVGPAFMGGVEGWSVALGVANNNPQALNTWYHIALVYESQKLTLYVNGKPVTSTPFSGVAPNLYDPKLPFRIGAAPGVQNGFYFKGMIAEARVWSRALQAAELNNNLHQCFVDPASPGLEAYWRMNDNKNELTDYSGKGHTATLKGDAISWTAGITCP